MEEHNDLQCKALSKSISLLKRAKSFLTNEAFIKMYTQIEKLYKMQKRAARVITGTNYEIESSEIFERLGWEPIEIIIY